MDYEALAKAGEPMPDGLTPSEQMAFQAISLLTSRFRLGKLSADQAKKEMQLIRKNENYGKNLEEYMKHCSDLWLNIETAAREFAKERTIEAAEKMYQVIYNIKLGEKHDDRER